jgi:hypothetical protein
MFNRTGGHHSDKNQSNVDAKLFGEADLLVR